MNFAASCDDFSSAWLSAARCLPPVRPHMVVAAGVCGHRISSGSAATNCLSLRPRFVFARFPHSLGSLAQARK